MLETLHYYYLPNIDPPGRKDVVAANILLTVNVRSVAAGRMPCLLDDFSMLDCVRGDSWALLVLSMVCYTSAYTLLLLLLLSIRPDETHDSLSGRWHSEIGWINVQGCRSLLCVCMMKAYAYFPFN